MTLGVQLSTAENSDLGMLVKFVADPVVWWELSSSRVTRTQTRTLPKASHCLHRLGESARLRRSSNVAPSAGGLNAGSRQCPRSPRNRSRWSGPWEEAPQRRWKQNPRLELPTHTLPRTLQLRGSPQSRAHFLLQLSKETTGEKFTARREVEPSSRETSSFKRKKEKEKKKKKSKLQRRSRRSSRG